MKVILTGFEISVSKEVGKRLSFLPPWCEACPSGLRDLGVHSD